MNLGDIIVQGGLTQREWGRQKEEAHVRDLGFKQRNLQAQQIAADEGLLPARTDLERMKVTGQTSDLRHQEGLRPIKQATETADLQAAAARAPTERATKQIGAETALAETKRTRDTQASRWKLEDVERDLAASEAEWKKAHQGLDQRTRSTQLRGGALQANEALNSLKMKQSVLLYQLYTLKGADAVLKVLNENHNILGDVQYESITETADQAGEKTLVLTTKDGQETAIKVSALEQLAQQYGSTYEKAGDTIVRVGPDGVKPAFAQPKWKVDENTGLVYNENALERPELNGLGGGGARAAGYNVTKNDKALDDRVKMAINGPLMHRYGGRFEGGVWFPDDANKDNALKAAVRAEQLIRGGMVPVAAAEQAINEVEKTAGVNAVAPDVARGNAVLDQLVPQR